MKSQDQVLLEQAYTYITEETDQDFSYYSGPDEDIMFLDSLDGPNLKRKMEQGKAFKTVFLATREDAVNYGYPSQPGHKFYVFYSPQDFTKPALIPV